jgi:acyl-CoA thioesterase YciA
MFPKDTNPAGNIFGGVILSYIDIAAGVAARTVTKHNTVTVCMNTVVFKRPVKVGDLCIFRTEIVKIGRTSVTVKVTVEADRDGTIIPVTEGEAVFVAVDEFDRPIPLDSPLGTLGEEQPQPTTETPNPVCNTENAASENAHADKHDHEHEQRGPCHGHAEPEVKKDKKKKKDKDKKKKKKK